MKIENDDKKTPQFLKESLLIIKRAIEVIKAIKKVIGMLPSSDTDNERSKKKLGDSGKGEKAKVGQKKQKEDSNLVENTKSQQQCEPSKKLHNSD